MKRYAKVCLRTGDVVALHEFSFGHLEPTHEHTYIECESGIEPDTHCYDLNAKRFLAKQPVPYAVAGTRVTLEEGTFFCLDAPRGDMAIDGVVDESGFVEFDVDEPGAYRLILELAPYQTTEVVIDVR